MGRKPVVAVKTQHKDLFQDKCNELFSDGYFMSSSSCGVIPSEAYDFQSVWQAIFVDGQLSTD